MAADACPVSGEPCPGCDHECLACGAPVTEGGSACAGCRPMMEAAAWRDRLRLSAITYGIAARHALHRGDKKHMRDLRRWVLKQEVRHLLGAEVPSA